MSICVNIEYITQKVLVTLLILNLGVRTFVGLQCNFHILFRTFLCTLNGELS